MSSAARREPGPPPPGVAAFAAAHAARQASLAPGPAAWLHSVRREAFARFERRGVPTTRDEAFRATSLAPVGSVAWRAPSAAAAVALTAERYVALRLPDPEGPRLVFVDGLLAREVSRMGSIEPGLTVLSLAEAAASERARLESVLAPGGEPDDHPLRSLCEALWADGVFAFVPAGVHVPGTLHLVSLASGDAAPAFHLRSAVVLEEGARLCLLETHASLGDGAALSNGLVDVVLGPTARLDHARVEAEHGDVIHVASLRARLARGAALSSVALTFGGRLARVETDVRLEGEGAECDLDGVYAAGENRHVDHQTFVDHAVPRCSSRQLQAGLLTGRAHGVFNGRVLVRPQSQKTDARQRNRNLLLSREATVDAKPELEIHADDVKCAHGATIGRLSEDALFYLRSRGLSPDEARRLLTEAFAVEVLDRVKVQGLREFAEGRLRGALDLAGTDEP